MSEYKFIKIKDAPDKNGNYLEEELDELDRREREELEKKITERRAQNEERVKRLNESENKAKNAITKLIKDNEEIIEEIFEIGGKAFANYKNNIGINTYYHYGNAIFINAESKTLSRLINEDIGRYAYIDIKIFKNLTYDIHSYDIESTLNVELKWQVIYEIIKNASEDNSLEKLSNELKDKVQENTIKGKQALSKMYTESTLREITNANNDESPSNWRHGGCDYTFKYRDIIVSSSIYNSYAYSRSWPEDFIGTFRYLRFLTPDNEVIKDFRIDELDCRHKGNDILSKIDLAPLYTKYIKKEE